MKNINPRSTPPPKGRYIHKKDSDVIEVIHIDYQTKSADIKTNSGQIKPMFWYDINVNYTRI